MQRDFLDVPFANQVVFPCLQRRRGQREAAALGGDSLSLDTGRPSRRAATVAQAAMAQAHASEHPRAGTGASSQQAAAAPAPEEASGQGGGQDCASQRASPDPAAKAQSEAEAFAAAAVAAALARSQGGAAAAGAKGGVPTENGLVAGGKKRKRAADGTPAGAALAAPAGGATPVAAPPSQPQLHIPSQEVDLAPVLELARVAATQEELRQKLQERYPPTRGRAAVNTMFRDLFLTLCPGQLFHVSAELVSGSQCVAAECMLQIWQLRLLSGRSISGPGGKASLQGACPVHMFVQVVLGPCQVLAQLYRNCAERAPFPCCCRAAPQRCRTCRTACLKWLASLLASRLLLTSRAARAARPAWSQQQQARLAVPPRPPRPRRRRPQPRQQAQRGSRRSQRHGPWQPLRRLQLLQTRARQAAQHTQRRLVPRPLRRGRWRPLGGRTRGKPCRSCRRSTQQS